MKMKFGELTPKKALTLIVGMLAFGLLVTEIQVASDPHNALPWYGSAEYLAATPMNTARVYDPVLGKEHAFPLEIKISSLDRMENLFSAQLVLPQQQPQLIASAGDPVQ